VAQGRLWGRGAADMKGGVATAVAAALRFVARAQFAGSISFLLTGDEEGPAFNGTVKLLEWARARGQRFDHCIVGEPTSVAELGRRVVAAAADIRVELDFAPTNAVAFLTPRGAFTDLVARAIHDVTGRQPRLSTSGGTSDARFIKDACPVVEIGLVGASMHAV